MKQTLKKKILVEVLNGETSENLEKIITFYLENNYVIQNSWIELHCGKIQGVYVFILEE